MNTIVQPSTVGVGDLLRDAGGVTQNVGYQNVVHMMSVDSGQQTPTSHTMERAQRITVQTAEISFPEEFSTRQEGQGSQAVWMVRLGEFFQRRVSQVAASVAPMLERPVRGHTITSPPASWMTPPTTVARPLFTPEAERTMQQWPQQAPLLHGAEVQPGQTAQRDTVFEWVPHSRASSYGSSSASAAGDGRTSAGAPGVAR